MKILSKFEEKTVKIRLESLNDLWETYTILDSGDLIRGKTIRKITTGDKNTEKTKVSKKPMFLGISIEKVSFEEDLLKVLGTIIEGPDDIPKGSHHSFNLTINHEIEIEKNWLNFQKQKLINASNKKTAKIICCLFNREEAIFGKLQRNYFTKISKITGNVAKKDYSQTESNFFLEITKILNELNFQLSPDFIILGSSHFWQNSIKKELEKTKFKQKCIYTTVNSVTESGFAEILLKQEVQNALKKEQAIKDAKIVDDLFKKIMNNEPICYGIDDCKQKVELGAVEKIICTDNLIKKLREEDKFKILEEIFKNTEKNKGEIHIMSGESDALKRLNGIGGIAAILRFKI